MGDLSRRLGRPVDAYGAAFLGDTDVRGDIVAGNKIIQLAPEQRTLPAQLPADISGFTGRRGILDQLDTLTNQEGPRTAIITAIHGMAGVGKTALAVHWAHRAADQFPDGQLYVDMRGYSRSSAMTPAEALGRFLRALGVPDERIPEDEDERAALYRSVLATRRALIILDNASSPQQVRPLLPGSSTCRTLVTSRNQLSSLVAHTGARTLAVDVLSPSEAAALITMILGAERVAAEPKAAEQLAQQCTYLPLALRIAAAHVAIGAYGSIAELVDELAAGNRLTTLECDDDPHLAVRCAFDLSYRHLNEPERRAFRHTGLVEGPDFTPDIIAALLDAPLEATRRSLRILASAHLIEPKSSGRFRLHDLLREYAQERAELKETLESRHDAVRRLVLWYIGEAARFAHCLDPYRRRLTDQSHYQPANHVASVPWFEAERAGLMATAQQVARMGMAKPVWQLADAAYDFLRRRRYSAENIALLSLGLSAARSSEELAAQAHVLHHLAALHMELGHHDEAVKHAKDALKLDRDTADTLHTRRIIGTIYAFTGRYGKALDVFERDLQISRRTGDPHGEAATLTSVGMVHRYLGRPTKAIACFQEALAIQRSVGDRPGEAATLSNLAGTYHVWLAQFRQAADAARLAFEVERGCADRGGQAQTLRALARINIALGQPRRALRFAQRSLAICRAIGDRLGEAWALGDLSWLLCDLGVFHAAAERARESLAIHRDIGNLHGEAKSQERLSHALSRAGRRQEAFDSQLRAVQIYRESDDHFVGRALNLLARLAVDLGQPDNALEYAEESLGDSRRIGFRIGEAGALYSVARINRNLGRPRDAIVHAKQSLNIRREIGDRRGESESLDCIACAYLDMGNYAEALDYAKQALTVTRQIEDLFGQGWAHDHLGRIYLARGDAKRAVRHFEEALRIRRRIRDRYGEGRTLGRLAEVYNTLGRQDEASAAAERVREIERLARR